MKWQPMELLMIKGKTLKDQENPFGTITEDKKAEIGSPLIDDLIMDFSPSCPKAQERSLPQKRQLEVSNSLLGRAFPLFVKGIKKERVKASENQRVKGKKDKGTALTEAPILMIRKDESYMKNNALEGFTSEGREITFPSKDIKETFKKFRLINMKLNPKKCSFGIEECPFLGHLVTSPQPLPIKWHERSLPFFKVLKRCTDKKNIQWTQEAKAALQEMKKFVEILPTLTAPIQGEVLIIVLQGAKLNKNLVITSCVEIRNKDLHDETKRISKELKDVSNESTTTGTICSDAFEVTHELSKRIIELGKDLSKFKAKSIAFEIALQHKSQENTSLKILQKENENFMASLQIENAHLKQTYKDLFDSVQRSRVETNE
ncbi:hypothetical protein Tco_1212886 [Tanacetum coccineum]